MDEGRVSEIIEKVEKQISKGNFTSAKELGFWKVVSAAKKDNVIAEKYAQSIGKIDKRIFESKTGVKLDYKTGTLLELALTIIGFILLYLGSLSNDIMSTILYTASALILMTSLHPISHIIAGYPAGIGFHFYFLNGPLRIEPTLKVDYATYIRASPRSRALFHLAGAINSVLITFLVLFVALLIPETSLLTKTVLAAVFIFTLASEFFPVIFIKIGVSKILFADFRKSDTHRFLREWNG